MKFKAHATAGLLSGAGLTGLAYAMEAELSKNDMILIAPMVFLGSIFSDLDTKSTATKWYATIMVLLLPLFIYSNMPWLWVTVLVPFIAAQASTHRGWTHSFSLVIFMFSATIIMEFTSWLIPEKWLWIKEIVMLFQLQIDCFAVGILVHKILDTKAIKKLFGE